MTSAPRAPATTETTDDSRRTSTLLGLLFGLAGMGSSSAAVTLPLLGDDLGVDAGLAAWAISLYVLMLAVTTALYGRISDLVGVRRARW
jgi:MFS family permease